MTDIALLVGDGKGGEGIMTYEEKIIWHEVIKRPPTEEEKEERLEKFGYEPKYILDCVLPDDGQEILIVTKWGVDTDICGIDDEDYYLENWWLWDDVIAWAEMPKYKAGEADMVEVVRCTECAMHSKCIMEDTFITVGITDGYCRVGRKVEK